MWQRRRQKSASKMSGWSVNGSYKHSGKCSGDAFYWAHWFRWMTAKFHYILHWRTDNPLHFCIGNSDKIPAIVPLSVWDGKEQLNLNGFSIRPNWSRCQRRALYLHQSPIERWNIAASRAEKWMRRKTEWAAAQRLLAPSNTINTVRCWNRLGYPCTRLASTAKPAGRGSCYKCVHARARLVLIMHLLSEIVRPLAEGKNYLGSAISATNMGKQMYKPPPVMPANTRPTYSSRISVPFSTITQNVYKKKGIEHWTFTFWLFCYKRWHASPPHALRHWLILCNS